MLPLSCGVACLVAERIEGTELGIDHRAIANTISGETCRGTYQAVLQATEFVYKVLLFLQLDKAVARFGRE